jgi:hypothetical protein
MVISYNQKFYFKIQCRKFINKIIIHFGIFLILQRIHTIIWIWKTLWSFYFSCLVKISIENTARKFHVLLKWNQTSRLNILYEKIEFLVSTITYIHISLYSKIVCLQINILFPKLPSLGSPQIIINMIQN